MINKLLDHFRVKPSFLIIGAQKAGTSALHYYLSQHPELASTSQKEIDFFSCSKKFFQGYSAYHRYFPILGLRKRVSFEASPSYLPHPYAAERIYNYNSDIKLLALVRDPILRAYSGWRMYFRYFSKDREWFIKWKNDCCGADWGRGDLLMRTSDSIPNFDNYVQQELDAIQQGVPIEAPVLSHGLYHMHIRRYAAYFDTKQLLLLESGELMNHTISSLKEIEKFLGLSPYDWNKADLRPIFVGEENKTGITEKTIQILRDYYQEDNESLQRDYRLFFSSKRIS